MLYLLRNIKESIGLMVFGFSAAIIFYLAFTEGTAKPYFAFTEGSAGLFIYDNETVAVSHKEMLFGGIAFLFLLVSNLALFGYLKSAAQYSYLLISVAAATNLFILVSGLDEVLRMMTRMMGVEDLILWLLAASRGDISLNDWYSALAKLNGIVAGTGFLIGSAIMIWRTMKNDLSAPPRL